MRCWGFMKWRGWDKEFKLKVRKSNGGTIWPLVVWCGRSVR